MGDIDYAYWDKKISKLKKKMEKYFEAEKSKNDKFQDEGGNMQTIKAIKGELGEECKVDIDMLHEDLLKLPAEKYLELYHKMQEKIIHPYYVGGCSPVEITENQNME